MPPIVRPLRNVGGDDDEVDQANEAPIMTTERARSVAIGGEADSSRMSQSIANDPKETSMAADQLGTR
jgi:hypothetical protein